MVRQQVRDIRVRRLVQALHVRVLKVDSYHFICVFQREDLQTSTTLEIIAVNVDKLNKFNDGDVVTVETLQEKGIINNPKDGVKILGNGELTKKLTVQLKAYGVKGKKNQPFSKTAVEKIEALGWEKAEVI